MNTPILLLCWRRPHTLRQVVAAIRPLSPSLLYVACDGPNPSRLDDYEKVSQTRSVIDKEIDWPCQIERLYSDVNQGCRLGVSRAITWFFEHVEEGIILEDDCVPHPDFFVYCHTLLERYRHDSRVWCISGNNFQDGNWCGDGDYFFGKIPMCWGWATWRSRWIHYDSDLKQWPLLKQQGLLSSLIPEPVMRSYWSNIWDLLFSKGVPDSWAYRWAFTCVVESGLTALPKINLVENIGFGVDATHTLVSTNVRSALSLSSTSLDHPLFIASHNLNDIAIFDHHFGGNKLRFPYCIFKPLKALIRKALHLLTLFSRS